MVQKEIQKGTIKEVDAKKLIINILSLCIFPIIARPIIEPIIFENDKNAYKEYIKNRKDEVMEIVLNIIQ